MITADQRRRLQAIARVRAELRALDSLLHRIEGGVDPADRASGFTQQALASIHEQRAECLARLERLQRPGQPEGGAA